MDIFENLDSGNYLVAVCIGDDVGEPILPEAIDKELLFAIRTRHSVFITRGCRGFEEYCIKRLATSRKKYPFIRRYAVVRDPEQKVYGRKYYDDVIVVPNLVDYENYFLENSETFICGNVSDSRFLLFEAWKDGAFMAELGRIEGAEDGDFSDYFSRIEREQK